MTDSTSETRQSASEYDPYHLTPEGIKEPPQGLRSSLRYLGPGLILSASIVGSGELVVTTTLGAEAGFALLWLVIISTLVKVAVQVELARWTISTGQPALTGYNKVPPKLGRIGWINLVWICLALPKQLLLGGIVGGVAIACSLLFPIAGPPLGFASTSIWTGIIVVFTIGLLYSNRYRMVELGSVALVVTFAALTIALAVGLPFTPFAYSADDVLSGLSFQIPAGALGAAVAMFGITGVGADEITYYTYWCAEKGYARWAGPPDGSEEWARRANGWIKVMQKDAWLSWAVYTFSTFAFYLMGASVLHPQGLVPGGSNEMITTLSHIYTDVLGEWASIGFLIAAIAVLMSTLFANLPSWSRMYTNFLAIVGVFDWKHTQTRTRWIRIFTVALPILWGAMYLFIQAPVLMIQIAGILTGVLLMAIVVAVWYLRRVEIDHRLRGGSLFSVSLVVSSIAILVLGAYSVLEVFGFTLA
ncbi:Mn2+/Fe2+ NRAMP family transporter [Spinactinospora alkalitolerans]|uniref:Mn2+/Fe2+ NRAMP family transporter n=1 Tax=Spinactinospora alkalitolerans TaxID=687207 RepID=A0A852TTJ9_9ACTN|nr:Nramp family divalent metal transporter [Spinactinospora alkalitolerans]NYE45444.1 Mn2+/Fe2+ NRAMP family transporter [Spinactinospora alkalitolerans]